VAAQAQPSQAAEVASSSSSSGDSSSGQKTFHHGITYVSYEGNCFWVKFNNSGRHHSSAVHAISSSATAYPQQSNSTAVCPQPLQDLLCLCYLALGM
jgi:hypothetical protein